MFLKRAFRLTRRMSDKVAKQTKDETLLAIGPLDGRYSSQLSALSEYFSEHGLMKYRLKVELEWLKFLFREGMAKQPNGKPFSISAESLSTLDQIHSNFTPVECQRVKAIESITNHDVKAVEYYIKQKLQQFSELNEAKEYVHFCCTSEDINNISYALILTSAKDRFLIPTYDAMTNKLVGMAKNWADVPMLSRTHGQAASPTTIGKQIANFTYRVNCQVKLIKQQRFAAKLNGAVGNFNAHMYAYPEFDWPRLSRQFLTGLGLDFNPYTTQIEPHDGLATFYSILAHINTILIAMSRDFWMYTSNGYFKQKVKKGEIGSSTMPHKVNPIDFENAEGNLGLANSLANHFAAKLPISRMQRDLSDSTVLRNQGLAFGYSILAYKSLLKGFDKVEVNQQTTKADLDHHFEVVTQAVQTLLRKYGYQNPYELLKEMSRGKAFSKQDLGNLIEKLKKQGLSQKQLEQIRKVDPSTYIGNAAQMARNIEKYL